MKPYIVDAVLDEEGNVVQRTAVQVVSNPISAETSETMRGLLEQVVSEGGGKNAYIEGYRVGGKTGTAQVYIDGKVSRDVHIGSFNVYGIGEDRRINLNDCAADKMNDVAMVANETIASLSATYPRE